MHLKDKEVYIQYVTDMQGIFAKYTTMVNAFQPCFPSKVTLYIATLFAFLSINMIKKFMTTFCIFHKNLWDTQE